LKYEFDTSLSFCYLDDLWLHCVDSADYFSGSRFGGFGGFDGFDDCFSFQGGVNFSIFKRGSYIMVNESNDIM
jgi:hypothetical protein